MHSFDIIILLFISIFLLIGIKRGFILELFRLLSLLAGIVGAFLFYSEMYSILSFMHSKPVLATTISIITLFTFFFFSFFLIGWLLKKIIHISMLGWADRLLGAFTGLIKAAAIIFCCLALISFIDIDKIVHKIEDSVTYSLFNKLDFGFKIPQISKYQLPSGPIKKVIDLKEKTDNKINEINKLKNKFDTITKQSDTIREK